MVHHGGLELKRVGVSVAQSCGRDEHISMVPNVLLSEVGEISPDTVKTTGGGEERTVGDTLGEQ